MTEKAQNKHINCSDIIKQSEQTIGSISTAYHVSHLGLLLQETACRISNLCLYTDISHSSKIIKNSENIIKTNLKNNYNKIIKSPEINGIKFNYFKVSLILIKSTNNKF